MPRSDTRGCATNPKPSPDDAHLNRLWCETFGQPMPLIGAPEIARRILRQNGVSASDLAHSSKSEAPPSRRPISNETLPQRRRDANANWNLVPTLADRELTDCSPAAHTWGSPIWAGSSQFTDGQTTAYYANVRVGRCTADGPILE